MATLIHHARLIVFIIHLMVIFIDGFRHIRVHVRANLDDGAEEPDVAGVAAEQEGVPRSGK